MKAESKNGMAGMFIVSVPSYQLTFQAIAVFSYSSGKSAEQEVVIQKVEIALGLLILMFL